MRTLTNRIIGLVLALAMLAGFVLVPTPMDVQANAATDYYLFGWINGANYACEEDSGNMGKYKFVDGKLTVRFDTDSYVGIKTGDNAAWYMTKSYVSEKSGTFFNTGSGANEKMLIPGGMDLILTLSVNSDGSLSLSYAPLEYYLFGWINGANYACEEDAANMGKYKFVNDQLVVHFDQDSYVGVKTTDNAIWYMAQSYVSDTTGMLYSTSTGASEKMFIPGGRDIQLTLIPHTDGSLTLMRTDGECIHDYTKKVTTAPTCTEGGVETFTCSKCGDSYKNILGATGHDYKSKVTTAATCTGNGVKTFTCSKCSHSYTEVIAATGHSYKNGKCSVCGKAEISCSHSYKSTVTKAATCEATGLKTHTCSKCGDVYTETIPATGHKYVDIIVPPTCDMNGYTQHKCEYCGSMGLNTDAVNPIGHNYSSVVTAPTCTEKGYTTYTCANCGHTYTWNETPATGHRFAGGKCTGCGLVDTNYVEEYYLFGYINGADYGMGEDYNNIGSYKFVDGKVSVTFTDDSYVAVKTGDNAFWYMTKGWLGEVTSANLYKFSDPFAEGADKLLVPGGWTVNFTLTKNSDGSLKLSYALDYSSCAHISHDAKGICSVCGASVGHSFDRGVCGICGVMDPKYLPPQYYLFGFINGANYGCEDDHANLGEYKFVDGKLTALFTEDCYVGVKKVDLNDKNNPLVVGWYVTDGWLGAETTSATLYDSSVVVSPDKLFVPGGAEITFTLVVNEDGTLSLSYDIGECHHLYGSFVSEHPTCVDPGVRVYTCGHCGYSYTEAIPALGHKFEGGKCTVCGQHDSDYVAPGYYLFGYIGGKDYGFGEDKDNLGDYEFVDGRLTVTFTEDSYVAVKTSDNAVWYMTNGYIGEATSATLYPFSAPTAASANKLLVSAGQTVTFILTENWDGTLTLSYTTDMGNCKHASHNTDGICRFCGLAVSHSYVGGVCTVCGGKDPSHISYDYYLFGYINGANYGCEDDYATLGVYKFSSTGTCSATFTDDSYVGIKAVNAATGEALIWYMTDGWLGTDVTSATLYDSTMLGNADKLFVPGNVKVSFTLKITGSGTVQLSYETAECKHTYDQGVVTFAPGCTTAGMKTYTCSLCGSYYTENMPALGHKYEGGKCTACGEAEPITEYYLFGFINSADYGCEADYENMGEYKFVNGSLTVRFETASYVGIKTTGNADFYMTQSFSEETSATFYNVATGAGEKMYIPGNTEVVMTLTVNSDGTLTLSYVAGECDHLYSSYVSTQPTCEAAGVRTHTCGYCGHSYDEAMPAWGHSYENGSCTSCGAADPDYTAPDYYLFGSINGTDIHNQNFYKFENGKLTVTFTEDSYVAVRTVDHVSYYMVSGYESDDTKVTLVEFDSPNAEGANYLRIPAGVTASFTLKSGWNGSLVLSYTADADHCTHADHNTDGICTSCGATVEHTFSYGVCDICRAADPDYNPYQYYLFGFINGTNYGAEDDFSNLGEYKFVDGKLTATFTEDSYVGVKKVNPYAKFGPEVVGWYMTDGWLGVDVTSATLYDSGILANADKLYVPGGCGVTFTLAVNEDGTLTLSYVTGECDHLYSSYVSTQPTCESTGVRTHTCGYCGHTYDETMPAWGHSFTNGICTSCGTADPGYASPDYYLFGYINGADYGWKDDINNLGYYKFENGKLTVRFDEASYVAVKTGDNAHFYMTNGYEGEVSRVTLIEFEDPNAVAANRMYVPGGAPVTLTLSVNENGSLELSYTLPPSACGHAQHNTDGICTACGTSVGHSFANGVCSGCGTMDPAYIPYEYYLFGFINGANYGTEEDASNLGEYKFADGKLTVTFEADSYVGIKKCNPNGKFGLEVLGWYMTDGWQGTEATSVTLYDSDSLSNADKLYIPGGVEVTFTLVRNEDGTLQLSYATVGTTQCSHSYTGEITTAATCEAAGVKTFTCSKCGHSYTSSIPATGHSYKSAVTTAATCTAGGVKTFTCTACSHSYTEAIAATGHNFANGKCSTCGQADSGCSHSYTGKVTTAATCDKTGVKTFTCSKCGDTYTETIVATGHTYASKVTAPTCTAEGYTTYTCTKCSNSYTDKKVAALGHQYDQGTITTSPGCEKEGVRTYTCSGCKLTKTEKIAATGHNYVDKVSPPTCTAEGFTKHTCSKCGNSYTDSKVAALGHKYNQGTITTSPGCEKEGVRTFTCTGCGHTKTEPVAATGHNYVDKVSPPTCTAEGFTKHTCTKCGNSYTDSKVAALGHKYNQGSITTSPGCEKEGVRTFTCTGCGHTKTEPVAATGHNYVDKVSPPTCTAEGFTKHTCTKCGNNYTDTKVDALGHKYNQGSITTSPGCEKEGVRTFTCTGCGHTKTEPVAATGHNYVDKVTAPTCTAEGFTKHTCSKCGNNYTDSKVAALGHKYNQGSITTSPGCEKEGVRTFTCTGCGETKTEPVAATGHNYVNKVTAPTCTAEGFTKHTCSRCGNNFTDSKVAALGHTYVNGKCTTCGVEDTGNEDIGPAAPSYYLVGYINGANHGIDEDQDNRGDYKFVDGKLTVTFTQDSYVCVKTWDNATWYMTNGWLGNEVTSATLYNSATLTDANKLFVPAGTKVTFTLTVGTGDTLYLSYTAASGETTGNGSISGSIADQGTGTVTVELWTEGAAAASYSVTAANGTYTIKNVKPGTYTMKVSRAGYVTRTYTVTVGQSAVTQNITLYLLGDVTLDGKVNIADVARIYAHVRGVTLITDAYTLSLGEVTGEGKINIADVARIYAHVRGVNPLW